MGGIAKDSSTKKGPAVKTSGNDLMMHCTSKAIGEGGTVIWDANFRDGTKSLHGMDGLMDQKAPQAPPVLTSRGALLQASEGPQAGRGGKPCGIKRMTRRPDGEGGQGGRYIIEVTGSYASRYGALKVRGWELGIDTADKDGNRNFARLRHMLYNDLASGDFPTVGADNGWYFSTGDSATPAFQPARDAGGNHIKTLVGLNEEKENESVWAFEIDLDAKCYRGIHVDGVGYGSLADEPDDDLFAGMTFSTAPLVVFANGFNFIFTAFNLVSAGKTAIAMTIGHVRIVQRAKPAPETEE